MVLEFLMAFLPVIIALGQFYMAQQLHQHQHLQLQNQIIAAAIAQREEQDDRRPRQARRFKRHPERRRPDRFGEYWNGEDERFVQAFRMQKVTFAYILEQLRPTITKMDVVGDTIPAETRLAVCLSRLVRGEYFYSIAENFGIGVTTAQNIYNEVIRAIHTTLYHRHVAALLPSNEEQMQHLQRFMDFPYAFAAIDGCHIKLQCPVGETSRKDYYNFKNFYSIILLAIVDGKGRFLWACSGMPGNCHDSTLLQSRDVWHRLSDLCHLATGTIGRIVIPAMILADNAFPFRSYIMKRFSHANRTPEQTRFNQMLSKDRVIVENTFGWLKMRFRELFRGSESDPVNLKHAVMAAVTLHNIMMDREGPPAGVLAFDDNDPIVMVENRPVREHHNMAEQVRNAILPLVIG